MGLVDITIIIVSNTNHGEPHLQVDGVYDLRRITDLAGARHTAASTDGVLFDQIASFWQRAQGQSERLNFDEI